MTASKTEQATASEASTTKTKEVIHGPDFSLLDDEEIIDIMHNKPKNMKERNRRDELMGWLQVKSTHKDNDFFALSHPGSEDEAMDAADVRIFFFQNLFKC